MTSKQTSTTKSDPWAPAKPGLTQTLNTANDWQKNFADRPLFDGSSVQGFDPSQTAALNNIDIRAQEGSPLVDASKGYVGDVLGGKYLTQGNPYFQQMSDAVTRSVMPGVNATFSKYGRTGSDAGHAYTLTKALGDAMAPIAYQDYQNERQIMDRASQFAPQLANQDYYDMDRQFAAGAARQGQGQAELSDEIARYYQEQYRPLTAAQEASSLTVPIAGLGGTSQTTQKTGANPLSTILGGAMMAYGAMNPAAGAAMGAVGGAAGGAGAATPMAAAMAPKTYVPPPVYTPYYYGAQ